MSSWIKIFLAGSFLKIKLTFLGDFKSPGGIEMKKIFFLVFLGFFTLTGCAGLQLENGSYSNRGMNATAIGAAIGAAHPAEIAPGGA